MKRERWSSESLAPHAIPFAWRSSPRAQCASVGCGHGPGPECRASYEDSTPVGAGDRLRLLRDPQPLADLRDQGGHGATLRGSDVLRELWAGPADDEGDLLDGLYDEPVTDTGSGAAMCLPALAEQLHPPLRLTGRDNRDGPPDHRFAADRDRYPLAVTKPEELLGDLPDERAPDQHQSPWRRRDEPGKQDRADNDQHPQERSHPPQPDAKPYRLTAMPLDLIGFPADDLARARRFWETLLDVSLEERKEGEGQGLQTHTARPSLGPHERGRGPGDRFSLPYFRVADLAQALERLVELGGSVVHPGERWAICRDSEGSPFGLAAGVSENEGMRGERRER